MLLWRYDACTIFFVEERGKTLLYHLHIRLKLKKFILKMVINWPWTYSTSILIRRIRLINESPITTPICQSLDKSSILIPAVHTNFCEITLTKFCLSSKVKQNRFQLVLLLSVRIIRFLTQCQSPIYKNGAEFSKYLCHHPITSFQNLIIKIPP